MRFDSFFSIFCTDYRSLVLFAVVKLHMFLINDHLIEIYTNPLS